LFNENLNYFQNENLFEFECETGFSRVLSVKPISKLSPSKSYPLFQIPLNSLALSQIIHPIFPFQKIQKKRERQKATTQNQNSVYKTNRAYNSLPPCDQHHTRVPHFLLPLSFLYLTQAPANHSPASKRNPPTPTLLRLSP